MKTRKHFEFEAEMIAKLVAEGYDVRTLTRIANELAVHNWGENKNFNEMKFLVAANVSVV